jgi:general nucleoside transport system permease protein
MSEREPENGGLERGDVESTEVVAEPGGYAPSVAERLALYQRAGGVATPVLTALFAFMMGGLVVAATGHNPITTYQGIFKGTGLHWLVPFTFVADAPFLDWHGWNVNTIMSEPAYNLTQTLLGTTTLILTGLAVAFAFRCGLFNIGGQGQYLIGAITGIWVGTRFEGLSQWQHILFVIVAASLAGALWAAIAGFLKAATGAHEVITTIMLNWIAYWIGSWAFGQGGPLQNDVNPSVPVSGDVLQSARLPAFWGIPLLQALHVGFFIALGALVVFWLILNRTTLGYEVRAVGFNPEAARYGGISVGRNYVIAMAISGLFAGLAGAMDMIGFQYRLGVLDVQTSTIGFIGIAVALLGRNTAVGVGLAALLFSALIYGTSTRSLDPEVFPPELAGNLTLMIQALVLLFISADVLILYLFAARRRLLRRRAAPAAAASGGS